MRNNGLCSIVAGREVVTKVIVLLRRASVAKKFAPLECFDRALVSNTKDVQQSSLTKKKL